MATIPMFITFLEAVGLFGFGLPAQCQYYIDFTLNDFETICVNKVSI